MSWYNPISWFESEPAAEPESKAPAFKPPQALALPPAATGGVPGQGASTTAGGAGGLGQPMGAGPDPAALEAQKVELAKAESAHLMNDCSFMTQEAIDDYFKGRTQADIDGLEKQYEEKYGDGSFATRFLAGSDTSRWDTAGTNPEEVTKAVNEILNKEGTFTYDCEGILDQLRGKSKQEIAAMRVEFEAHAGTSMDAWIKNACTGTFTDDDYWSEAQALISGDPVKGALASLDHAADWTGADEGKIFKVLEGLTPEQRKEATKQWNAAHPDEPLADKLDCDVWGEGSDNKRVKALLAGDDAAAIKVEMDEAAEGSWYEIFGGTDEDAMYAAMDKVGQFQSRDEKAGAKSTVSMEKLSAKYGSEDKLETFLKGELGHKGDAEYDKALYTLEATRDFSGQFDEKEQQLRDLGYSDAMVDKLIGDDKDKLRHQAKAKAKAADLKMATGGWGDGTDESAVWKALKGNDYKDVVEAYKSLGYGDANATLERELGYDLKGGRDKFGLTILTDGAGTDEDGLKELLGGKTKKEIAQLNAETGGLVDDILATELSGRDYHDIEMMKTYGGKDLDVNDKLAKAQDDWDFERGSGKGLLGWTLDGSDKAKRLDKEHGRILELQEAMDTNGQLSAEQLERLDALTGRMGGDVKGLRTTADTVAGIGAGAAGVLATALSGGTLGPLVAEALFGEGALAAGSACLGAATFTSGAVSGLAGGAATMLTKRGILGDAYGQEAFGEDLASTVASAGIGGAMKMPGEELAKLPGLGFLGGNAAKLEGGAAGLLEGVASTGTGAIDEAVANTGFLGGFATKGVSGGLANVGNQWAMKLGGVIPGLGAGLENNGTKLIGSMLGEGLSSAASSCLEKGVVGQLYDEQNWTGGKNGWGDILLKGLTSAGGGFVGGALGKGLSAGVMPFFDPRYGDTLGYLGDWGASKPNWFQSDFMNQLVNPGAVLGGVVGAGTGALAGAAKAAIDPKTYKKNFWESMAGQVMSGSFAGGVGGATAPWLKAKQDTRDVAAAQKALGSEKSRELGTPDIETGRGYAGDFKSAAKILGMFPGATPEDLEQAALWGGNAKMWDETYKNVARGDVSPFAPPPKDQPAPSIDQKVGENAYNNARAEEAKEATAAPPVASTPAPSAPLDATPIDDPFFGMGRDGWI